MVSAVPRSSSGLDNSPGWTILLIIQLYNYADFRMIRNTLEV